MDTLLSDRKLNKLYGSTFHSGKKKLSVAQGKSHPKITFNHLKEILTDPDVVQLFRLWGASSQLNTSIEWVCRIINGCAHTLPAEDVLSFAKFLVDDYVTNKVIRHPTDTFIRTIGYELSLIIKKTPPNEKSVMADILAKNDFGRIIFGKTNPIYITRTLSDGLTPKEFDGILSRTKLLADMPPHEKNTEGVLIDKDLIDEIARDALLRSKPHLREHEIFRSESRPSINEVCDSETDKQLFIKHAEEIVRIAFSHCKGTTEKPEKEDIPNRRLFSYLDKNLMNGESIVYRANLHWIIFLWPIVWLLVAIMFFAVGVRYDAAEDTNFAAGLFVLISILTGIGPLVNYSTSEFGITNKRVVVKMGFFRRNSLEVLLNKVEGIYVSQCILGRILGYGSISITGTGGTKDLFHKIEVPLEFRKKVQEQIAAVQDTK